MRFSLSMVSIAATAGSMPIASCCNKCSPYSCPMTCSGFAMAIGMPRRGLLSAEGKEARSWVRQPHAHGIAWRAIARSVVWRKGSIGDQDAGRSRTLGRRKDCRVPDKHRHRLRRRHQLRVRPRGYPCALDDRASSTEHQPGRIIGASGSQWDQGFLTTFALLLAN